MTKICPSCKTQIRDDEAQFCMKCGSALNAGTNPQGGNSISDAKNASNMDAIHENINTYLNQGDYANAQKWARKGVEKNDALCLHSLGEIAYQSNNLREAIKWFQRNVDINSFAPSAVILGHILMNYDNNPKLPTDHLKAKEVFEIAVKNNSENGEAWHGLGVAYITDEVGPDYYKAKQCFQKALQFGTPEIKQRVRELIKKLEIIEKNTGTAATSEPQGNFFADATMTESQSDFFSDAAINEPQGTGDFFAEASETQNAYSIEDAANAGNMDAIQELMMTYFNQGDYREAQKWAKKGAGSNDALCLHILGEMARINENFNESIQWFQRNVQINSFGKSASELGCILMNFDDNPKCPKDTFRAKGLFEFALQDDNTDGDAWFGLAVAHMDDEDAKDFSVIKQCFQNAYKYGSPEIKNMAQALLKSIQEQEQQQENSSGCYITTAVCGSFGKSDDCYELTMFRDFRDSWLRRQEDGKEIIPNIMRLPRALSTRLTACPMQRKFTVPFGTNIFRRVLGTSRTMNTRNANHCI